jgi:hypothetical protein
MEQTPQQRYYIAHREDILVKMREREKARRSVRKTTYEVVPENQEKDREAMRIKYRKRVASENRRVIDAVLAQPETPADVREFLNGVLMREEYKNYTRGTLRNIVSPTLQMPRAKKVAPVAVPTPAEPPIEMPPAVPAPVAVVETGQSAVLPMAEKPKKTKTPKTPKAKDVTVLDATEVRFYVEKGPIRVSFA